MKTQDLIGAQLDWAVAKCEGYVLTSDGISNLLVRENETLLLGPGSSPLNYSPICYWMQGGEIIEREGINLTMFVEGEVDPEDVGSWCAAYDRASFGDGEKSCTASTPLVAAMKAFVMAKLGSEINIPEELAP